ncbi:MAG: flagellar hook-basal body protein [Chloroflexi bacterium]|nr:MAG: flagellar hook-basal body protein [Chloroflexota bacterium]RLT53538.1 MAG: flagellar hook-basal body protein [Chloroflexota bacterium]
MTLNRGMYAAASAMNANLYRQELLSHNLANLTTAGFKQINTSLDDFVSLNINNIEGGSRSASPGKQVGKGGLGVIATGPYTDFGEGSLRETEQPFDFSISGNGFFAVQTPDGVRYTRDGRFTRDLNGHLVTADGFRVLDEKSENAIVPVPYAIGGGMGDTVGNVTVTTEGRIIINGKPAGMIGMFGFDNPNEDLVRDDNSPNLFIQNKEAVKANGRLRQGYLEMANVDPVATFTAMTTTARAYEAAQRVLQMEDQVAGRAVNDLGRV